MIFKFNEFHLENLVLGFLRVPYYIGRDGSGAAEIENGVLLFFYRLS